MKGKRITCMLLSAVLAASLLPLPAKAQTADIRILSTSGDFLSGYYVVYQYNGQELRSDLLGQNTNYDLWSHLSTADKKKVMKTFAFGPSWMVSQFGKNNVAKMNDWWNDDSGWAGARKVLADRIASREFPRAESAFGGSYEDKATVSLPDVEHPPAERYAFLPEVQAYLDNEKEMKVTFEIGKRAYETLKQTKMGQVSAAVTSLSGDLISLICERAMVPAITPGGLSALAPNLSGELLSLIDKMTGSSDKVIEMTVGKRVDASAARKIIDECWKIIEANEEFTEQCIHHFLSLKGRKASLYSAGAKAIDEYLQRTDEFVRANEDKARSVGGSSDGLQSVVPAELTDADVVVGLMEEDDKRERLLKEYEAFKKRYNAWRGELFGRADELEAKLRELAVEAMHYDNWPQDYRMADSAGPLDLERLVSYYYGPSIYYEDGERKATLPLLVDEMPAAFSAAIAEAAKDISDLDAYTSSYQALVGRINSEVPDWLNQWRSWKSRLSKYNISVTVPDLSYSIADFLTSGGSVNAGDGRLPLEDYRKLLTEYRQMLSEHESEWNEESSRMVAQIRGMYTELSALQARYAELIPQVVDAKIAMDKAIVASNEKYYGKEREGVSDELKAQFEAFDYDDVEGFTDLFNACGEELRGLWNDYEEAHRAFVEGQYELDWIEEKCQGISPMNYRTAIAAGGDYNAMYQGLFGGEPLLSQNEMAALRKPAGFLHDDGSDMLEVSNYDPEALNLNLDAVFLRHSYAEFTLKNNVTAEMGLFFDIEIGDWKGNFMRGDEETRKSIGYSLKSGQVLHYAQAGDRGQFNYPYTYQQYQPLWPMGGQRIDRILEGWRSESGSYTPVTGLGGGRLMADGYDVTLLPGETFDLGRFITVEPENASDKSLVWDSENDMICSVSDSGVLTGGQSGETTVTVRASDSAWVTGSDGMRVYTPSPLRYTVRVGTGISHNMEYIDDGDSGTPDLAATVTVRVGDGEEGLASMLTYGEENALYSAVDNGDGTTTVSLGVGMLEQDVTVLAALYSGGRLCGLRIITDDGGFAPRPAAFTAPNAAGLELRLFAVDAPGGFFPLGTPLLKETVK